MEGATINRTEHAQRAGSGWEPSQLEILAQDTGDKLAVQVQQEQVTEATLYDTVAALTDFLTAFGLPISPPEAMSVDVFLEAMALDKKVAAGKVRYVLLRELGAAILVDDVTRDEIALAIAG